MSMRLFVGVFSILAAGIFVTVLLTSGKKSESPPEIRTGTEFAPEVEQALATKLAEVSLIFQNAAIIAEIARSNDENARIDLETILERDAVWRAAGNGDQPIIQFTSNNAARILRSFQSEHPEFVEIFVTDAFGLNVAGTNRTSDYYQADEAWWIDSWNNSMGKTHHGEIEFDESAQSEAISMYVPIGDRDRVVGIGKAVVDLAAIKEQL